jgi:hypothetical protein
MTGHPNDPAQMSLGGIVANVPAVKRVEKQNPLSRVLRHLIEPIETEQDDDRQLACQHTFLSGQFGRKYTVRRSAKTGNSTCPP